MTNAEQAIFPAGRLFSTPQLASQLGMHRSYLNRLKLTKPDFPQPVSRKGKTDLWLDESADAIRAWLNANILPHYCGPPIERIFKRLVWSDENKFDGPGIPIARCLEWTGFRNPSGHATIVIGPGRRMGVHRFVYIYCYGDYPYRDAQGRRQDLDHLCRNPPCCNPYHLELVTMQENLARASKGPHALKRLGLCKRGHELSGDNVYTTRGNGIGCRICRDERRRILRAMRSEGPSTQANDDGR
jgi:hypothetical protein